jgi:hypothetical protein
MRTTQDLGIAPQLARFVSTMALKTPKMRTNKR